MRSALGPRLEALLLGTAGLAVLLGLLLIPADEGGAAYSRPLDRPYLTYPSSAWDGADGRGVLPPGRLVHLATSESPFRASFLLQWEEGTPPVEEGDILLRGEVMEVVLWTPRARERLRLVFRRDARPGCVQGEMAWIRDGADLGGTGRAFVACGAPEGLRVALGRSREAVWAEVRWGGEGRRLAVPLEGERLLWHREGALTLSVVARAGEGEGGFLLRDARVSLPGTGRYYAMAGPGPGRVLTLLVGLLALLALLPGLGRRVGPGRWGKVARPAPLLLALGFALLAAPLAWVAGFLGHLPFDVQTFQVNAYFAYREGLRSVYPGPDTVPLAWALNGHPLFSASSRYPPLAGYLFWTAGLLAEGLFRSPFDPLPNPSLEWVFRWLFLLFHLALAGLVFAAVRASTGRPRRALVGAALVGLNPALFLGTVPWVQSDGLALLLALAGWVLLALAGRPTAGWALLLSAVLVKPLVLPALVPAVPYGLGRYGLRTTASSLLRAGLVVVVLLLPFWAQGYHLRMLILPLVRRLFLESPAWHPVSFDAYTVWTGLTGLMGLHGLERLGAPAERGLVLSLGAVRLVLSPRTGYYGLGAALTALHLWALWRLRAAARPGTVFLLVGLYWVSLALVSTGASGRYVAGALPFLALAWALDGPFARTGLVLYGLGTLSGGVAILGALAYAAVQMQGPWPTPTLLHTPLGGALFRLWQGDLTITLFSTLAGGMVLLCVGTALALGRRGGGLPAGSG